MTKQPDMSAALQAHMPEQTRVRRAPGGPRVPVCSDQNNPLSTTQHAASVKAATCLCSTRTGAPQRPNMRTCSQGCRTG